METFSDSPDVAQPAKSLLVAVVAAALVFEFAAFALLGLVG